MITAGWQNTTFCDNTFPLSHRTPSIAHTTTSHTRPQNTFYVRLDRHVVAHTIMDNKHNRENVSTDQLTTLLKAVNLTERSESTQNKKRRIESKNNYRQLAPGAGKILVETNKFLATKTMPSNAKITNKPPRSSMRVNAHQ